MNQTIRQRAFACAPVLTTLPWAAFRQQFAEAGLRPLPPTRPLRLAVGLAPTAKTAIAKVLARFQLGEAGEGRIAREIDETRLSGIDDDYRQALKLFVQEEGRHARILAQLVRGLGGRLLRRKVSNDLFTRARRLLGLRFKLLVLLVAEVAGGAVYRGIADRVPDGDLHTALDEIAADERRHLKFHGAFFRSQAEGCGPGHRFARRAALWVLGLSALLVVLAENRRDLRGFGFSARALAADILAGLRQADAAAFAAGAPPWIAASAPRAAVTR